MEKQEKNSYRLFLSSRQRTVSIQTLSEEHFDPISTEEKISVVLLASGKRIAYGHNDTLAAVGLVNETMKSIDENLDKIDAISKRIRTKRDARENSIRRQEPLANEAPSPGIISEASPQGALSKFFGFLLDTLNRISCIFKRIFGFN